MITHTAALLYGVRTTGSLLRGLVGSFSFVELSPQNHHITTSPLNALIDRERATVYVVLITATSSFLLVERSRQPSSKCTAAVNIRTGRMSGVVDTERKRPRESAEGGDHAFDGDKRIKLSV